MSETDFLTQFKLGPLILPPRTTARAESGIREDHKRNTKLHHDVVHIKNALKKLISGCVDEDYFAELQDPVTNVIVHDIPFVQDYLFISK